MHAGPVVMLRMLDHRGANGVELDIAVRGKKVVIRVDQAGFEASFPQRSGASMAVVEGRHIRLAKLAHGQRYLARLVGTDEQMHVIAHQNVGVNSQAMFRGALAQQTEVVATVVVIQKDGASIDPALCDVEWYPRYFQASLAWREWSRWPEYPSVFAQGGALHRRHDTA